MSTVLDSFNSVNKHKISCEDIHVHKNYPRKVLKSKENTYKIKFNKELKNKLKKYKLRKDGREDQDILDVSHTLLSSLKIKSPRKNNLQYITEDINFKFPENYISKMVRKKKSSPISNKYIGDQLSQPQKDMCPNIQGNNCDSQETKSTNAFKFMMDSRNKIIGSNSPGKDKILDETEIKEYEEKKILKIKRNLALEKLAEKKGSHLKKELDEYQEECIKLKMIKRAERLKSMIINNNSKNSKENKNKVKKPDIISNHKNVSKSPENSKIIVNQTQTLKVIDIFDGEMQCCRNIIQQKHVSKEDEEFLKKLSPSIKKKENMLSYFKKVEKGLDSSSDQFPNATPVKQNSVIKVKVYSRTENKAKKKNKNLIKGDSGHLNNCNRNNLNNSIDLDPNSFTYSSTKDIEKCKEVVSIASVDLVEVIPSLESPNLRHNSERRKRKRDKEIKPATSIIKDSEINTDSTTRRTKRNIKRPVKYSDDIQLSSSDEELYIFTPVKKKAVSRPISNERPQCSKHPEKLVTKNIINTKKDTKPIIKNKIKLAPIFATKTQVDPKVSKAKQKFLQSGVPDKIKKLNTQQINNVTDNKHDVFPTVVHVQQITSISAKVVAGIPKDILSIDDCDVDFTTAKYMNIHQSLIKSLDEKMYRSPIKVNNMQDSLQIMKKLYPKFPVYRTYRLLKSKSKGDILKECNFVDMDNSIEIISNMQECKNDNPDKICWTDKYKPISSNQVFGNFESIKELKKWLVSWTETETKHNNKGVDSDLSDFYNSDTDSRDSVKVNNNLLIINGPVGSGKNLSVYAVAAELAIKIIEVNAGNKRTGKIILQDLHEATQSHKVNRGKEMLKSQEIIDCDPPLKKPGRKKKLKLCTVDKVAPLSQQQPISQDGGRTGMSLILIDDADIVFEQDDGFCSAISQLTHCSKRPVILITSSLTCPHLQRFIQSGKIITMKPFLPTMLGTWLDIMCLADSGICWPGLGKRCLDFFNGDIRKAINNLQFYVSTETLCVNDKIDSQNTVDCRGDSEEENSCMSWTDSENVETSSKCQKSLIDLGDSAWKYFMSDLVNSNSSSEMFNIWWTLPNLLDSNSSDNALLTKEKKDNIKDAIALMMDSISVADLLSKPGSVMKFNITSHPWQVIESDSLSECENIENFNVNYVVSDNISNSLVSRSFTVLQRNITNVNKTDICHPDMAKLRERNRTISRHHNLTRSLNPATVLDRRALALDYWPAFRTICRTEKARTDNKSKRNNRYCHYLKSMNPLCKSDTFDALGDSFISKNN